MSKTTTDFNEAHSTGKTYKETETGVQYPDGRISWNPDFYNQDISTPEGRVAAQESFDGRLKNLGALPTRPLIFLQRVKTIKYTNPEVIS